MMIDPYAAAVKPQILALDLERAKEPEDTRPVDASAESHDTGLDVEREKTKRERRVE